MKVRQLISSFGALRAYEHLRLQQFSGGESPDPHFREWEEEYGSRFALARIILVPHRLTPVATAPERLVTGLGSLNC